MKKFGNRNLQFHNPSIYNNESIYTNYEDDNIYEKEFSKRLISSNSYNHTKSQSREEQFYLFKKQKKIEKEINQKTPDTNTHQESTFNANRNPSQTAVNKPKIKRLSELEQNNLYFILNIEHNSSKDNIKRAYKNLCFTHHPDKGGNSETFSKINKAYQILMNDLCRKLYDNFSHSAMTLIDYIINNSHTNESMQYLSDEINLDIDTLDLDALNAVIKMNENR